MEGGGVIKGCRTLEYWAERVGRVSGGGAVCILFKKREVTSGLTGFSRGFPSFCTNENTLCQISTLPLSRNNVLISLAFYTKHSKFISFLPV